MKQTKFVALLLVVALSMLAFAGCSQASAPPASSSAAAEQPSSSAAAPAESAADSTPAATGPDYSKIKVGVVLNTGTQDGGWSQAHNEAFLKVKADLGLSDDQMLIVENIPDTGTDCENVIESMISEGCNMIFLTSSGLSVTAAAQRHPDVYFHKFESETLSNLAAYSVRDWEAIFMCGYVSAKMSDVDELGFMAAQPQSSVVRAVNAFAAGAKSANPNATVKVVWANSWYDPAIELEGATGLYQSGIKSLGYHGSTNSVAKAATDNGGYCTGFHIDMRDYGPSVVLTSFMWNWAPIYTEFINKAASGTWTNETVFPGIASGCAGLAPYNTDIVSAEIIAECKDMEAKIASGEVKVFEGPVKDNKGNEVLAAGAEFTDAELIGMMFLLDNVIGDLP